MAADTRRFHPRYTRPTNGAILETVDAVRFRVELEDLAVLSTYFENYAAARVAKPIQLALISSETLLFTLDLLTGSLGGGRAPRVPELTEEFLDELVSLTFIYQLCGPLAYVAREAAGPRPHLGRSHNPVIAYTLMSLYQRWVAQNSPHLAAQLEKDAACRTPILGIGFHEKDFAGWPQRALQEYHPVALRAMRAALARRRELETRLDAIDALPLEDEGPCRICNVSEEEVNGTLSSDDDDEDGGDGYVHVETEEERWLRRRQRVLGPRLAKLEKMKDAALVAHLGYCCVRCAACRSVVRGMLLRMWTYGALDEWRLSWHFDTEFKFPQEQLDTVGHDCADPSEPCLDATAYGRSRKAGYRDGSPDDASSSDGTEKPCSVASVASDASFASAASGDTAKGVATSREASGQDTDAHSTHSTHAKDRVLDDHYDLYQAGLVPPGSTKPSSAANAQHAQHDENGSIKSGRSGRSLQAPSFASQTTSQESEGPFRYDDDGLDTTDSESSYGHLPESDSMEELDEHYDRFEGQYGGYNDEDDDEDSFGHGSGHNNTPSPTGTVRVLGTPTNILGVITETEEEYESSRESFASNRQLSPNPVGTWLEREESDTEENGGDMPAIVITGTEGERALV
ncbi:hypothetical protein A1Q2_07916 [Trichosporon asahii var. asahii CBS 8904]|uniref:Uncharacterized protein n=1 Tax=Trichosporon asahii var. asahii (strain CBS 8904) TaxID=1220162 RepID=K1VLX9_TRIAC|nr:hypothetical protein A1Q2_07916 [Trichosporon asahii var. asahii CBS 8904]